MFFLYTFKWALCVALFYSCWSLLLRRETFHRLNRVLLVSFLLVGAVLPLLRFPAPTAVPLAGSLARVGYFIDGAVVAAAAPGADAAAGQAAPQWPAVVGAIYIIGAVGFLLQYALNVLAVVRLIRRSRLHEVRDGMRVCLNDTVESPVSWMHWVVISPRDLAENGATFLAHESAHVRGGHSLELLVAEVCVRLQWFNPLAWMLLHDLQTVQEYEADRAALHSGTDCRGYATLLVTKAVGPQLAAANSLLRSPLKARVGMMARPASRLARAGRALFALPVVGFALLLFARPDVVAAVAQARTLEELPAAITAPAPDSPDETEAATDAPAVEPENADSPSAPAVTLETDALLPPLTNDYLTSLLQKHDVKGAAVYMINDDAESPVDANRLDFFIDGRRATYAELRQYADRVDLGDPRVCVFNLRQSSGENTSIAVCDVEHAKDFYPGASGQSFVVSVVTNPEYAEAEMARRRSALVDTATNRALADTLRRLVAPD